ncbi:MAG TPA: hypothetical protein VEJ16_07055 [Alphaproteobacteria bacterium]|nr:hypothetical protein [Alphaproteobacteria bacterium]
MDRNRVERRVFLRLQALGARPVLRRHTQQTVISFLQILARLAKRLGVFGALSAMALSGALAGCGQEALPCPDAKILREADQVTKFAPGQDGNQQAITYIGHVAQARLNCSYDPKTYESMRVALGIQIEAQRTPTAKVDAAELRYFVAIVNLQGEILARQDFPLNLPFKPGQDTVSKVEQINQLVPLKYPQNGGSLQIWVGFQLSDAELQYNRQRYGN